MKTLKCDLCEVKVGGETFEEWMEALKPHYGEAHADFMKQKAEQPEDEQMAGMQRWVAENKARFDARSADN